MIALVSPSKVSGIIKAPASKSAMQRACALALIHNGETYLTNAGHSNDDLAALDVIQRLGGAVKKIDSNTYLINSGTEHKPENILDCGESGLGLRMFTPIAALNSHEITITGSGSLMKRPMDFFDMVLPQLGVTIHSNNGKLPLRIKGPLIASNITIDGSLSSQFLTGLIISFAASCKVPVTITVVDLKSKPYIDLTLQLMSHFGWEVSHHNYKEFYFSPSSDKKIRKVSYSVEGDWSGGAFILVAGAIAGNLTISGLNVNSTQADRKILEALKDAQAKIQITGDFIHISGSELHSFEFNATDCPDLFPPLVALASICQGETIIYGVSRLKHKESDRAATLVSEFTKMGVNIKCEGDTMKIIGSTNLKGCRVDSHHDHRIAMACAVAALRAEDDIEIVNAEAINKSYPEFFNDLKSINTSLQIL